MDNLLAYIYISIYNMYYHYTLLFPIPTQYDDNVASGAPGRDGPHCWNIIIQNGREEILWVTAFLFIFI